ncbi:MAG TPA: hypothetical protein VNP95_04600 [Thermomicrobiales bacterium]|nr:hypothetical protein [Thermomicrobiales bacterium]
MADGLFGRNGSAAGRRRRPLAPIATLLDLYRVGGLFNAHDLRTLADAVDDPEVVAALGITEAECDGIRRRAEAAENPNP